jgi:hypothetical protein
MPLKLNVGLSRKIGESNYGSRGASVNVEMELESALVGEPDKLQQRIRQLFGLVRTSLSEELNGGHGDGKTGGSGQQPNGTSQAGNGEQTAKPRPATQSQVRAIHAIAKSRKLDVKQVLQRRFRVARPEDLSIKEASTFIEEMNSDRNGG